MAIFGKKENKEKDQKQAQKQTDSTKPETALTQPKAVESKENTGDAYKILVKPLVSEKTFSKMSEGKYAFKVNPDANKIQVRNAVERVYDVKVARVNMITVRGKTRNFGKTRGRTSDWKKAIVTLKPGSTIAQAA